MLQLKHVHKTYERFIKNTTLHTHRFLSFGYIYKLIVIGI